MKKPKALLCHLAALSMAVIFSFTASGFCQVQALETNTQATIFQDMSAEEVVEFMGPVFTEDMENTGILACVSFAQFIWESGYGKSELAQNANNCFGMKAGIASNYPGSTWDGESVYLVEETNEQNPDGTWTTISAEFRKYESVQDSITDHSAYLAGAKKGDGEYRYPGIVGMRDYKEVCQLIYDGGYATDQEYVDKLVSLIERWDLTRFDAPEETLLGADEFTGYEDVDETMWYAECVEQMRQKGYMTGVDETHFAPDDPMTRAMAITVIHRIGGCEDLGSTTGFEDCKDDVWYSKPICYGVKKGIITGYDDKHFGPNDNVTREQLAVMVYRFLTSQGIDTSPGEALDRFEDAKDVSSYAKEAMEFCVYAGIISGAEEGTMLYPKHSATRAECAKILLYTSSFLPEVSE